MIEVVGQYNTAVCYTGELEEAAAGQIKAVCDQSVFADCKIRIMPDVHAGMGCTIGTTMTITNKIVPGMVGVDIGCTDKETEVLYYRTGDFCVGNRGGSMFLFFCFLKEKIMTWPGPVYIRSCFGVIPFHFL